MKTCSVQSKCRNQYQGDNRETNNELNSLYTLFTMINIFHDTFLLQKLPLVPKTLSTFEPGQKFTHGFSTVLSGLLPGKLRKAYS